MNSLTYVLLAVAAIAVLVALAAVWVAVRGQRRVDAQGRADVAALHEQIEALTEKLEATQRPADEAVIITDAGIERPEPNVPERLVLSATVGEPLVKSAALVHGLRRALSPEVRNRIGFEFRQEVRRARKQRRQDLKAASRQRRQENAA